MFDVVVWNVRSLTYVLKFNGDRVACEDWVNTRRMIGDKNTYLILPV